MATAFTDKRTGYLPGLEVNGNTLTGTVLVEIDNFEQLGVDAERIISSLKLVNQSAGSYKIDLNIKEATFWSRLTNWNAPRVTIRPVRDMDTTYAAGAGAAYVESGFGNVILVEPDAPRHWIEHEFLHNLGLGHSAFAQSVMFPAAGKWETNHIQMRPGEIRNLVEGYRAVNAGKRKVP